MQSLGEPPPVPVPQAVPTLSRTRHSAPGSYSKRPVESASLTVLNYYKNSYTSSMKKKSDMSQKEERTLYLCQPQDQSSGITGATCSQLPGTI